MTSLLGIHTYYVPFTRLIVLAVAIAAAPFLLLRARRRRGPGKK